MSPRYLSAVERAESGLSPRAHALTSSAAGPYQFIDQTWLRTLHSHGADIGMGREAALVRLGANGRASVADPGLRAALLSLRYDPELSGLLAAALTRENATVLGEALGRRPSAAELYAAHLFGPQGALILLAANRSAPWTAASALLPKAAASNPALFYASGVPRSVNALFSVIAAKAALE